ncbi:MAG: tetratricopeptide repeat protein [Bacteroidia bacterium]
MKKLIVLTVAILSVSLAYSQKAKVQTAYSYMKEGDLDKAKQYIDEASVNEGSMGMAKTWYYRGQIYQGMFKNAKYGSLSPDPLGEAYKSYKKALEIDPKYEYKDEITQYMAFITASIFNDGLASYEAKDYNKALTRFETILEINPNDTSSIVNSALAADKAGMSEKAIGYYERLVALNYQDAAIYMSLVQLYKNAGQKDKATEALLKGRKAFPNDNNLMIEELNSVLQSGDDKKAAAMLDQAIAHDPENSSLYFAAGTIYDKLANPKDAKGTDLPKPENYTELVNKSAGYYTSAIAKKPDYFEANYNIGALYFNQGAELANKANNMPLNKQKEADALNKQAADKLKQAEPYLEKALALNPKDPSTQLSLKQLYVRTGETAKYEELKKLMDKQ